MNKNPKIRGALVVLGCLLLYGAIVGAGANTGGIMMTYVCRDLGFHVGDYSMTKSFTGLVAAFSLPFAGRLLDSKHLKRALQVALIGYVLTLLGMSQCRQLWQFYIMSLLLGICSAFVSTLPAPIIIGNWYRGKNGLLVSLCYCSSGFAGAGVGPLLSWVIERSCWQVGYWLVAAIILVFGGLAVFFLIVRRPEDLGMEPLTAGPQQPQTQSKTSQTAHLAGKGALVLFGLYTVGVSSATAISNHLNTYAVSLGFGAATAALMNSLLLVGNTGSKVLIGGAMDRFGSKVSTRVALLVNLGGMLLLLSSNLELLGGGSIACGVAYGLNSVVLAVLVREFFGRESYSSNFALFSMINTLTHAVSNGGVGYLYDLTGSYRPSVLLLLALLTAALVSVEILNRMKANRIPPLSPLA